LQNNFFDSVEVTKSPVFGWGFFVGGVLGFGFFISEVEMAAVTFDTHKFVRKLKDSGFEEKQAESLIEALQAAITESDLVTKKDLQIELAPLKADLNLLKWMVGALLGLAVTHFAKQFL
jgi:hypothetical protein